MTAYLLVILLCVVLALALVEAAEPAKPVVKTSSAYRPPQTWQWNYRAWMPAHWQRLAQCESGSNPPDWKHNSGMYQGGFGFYYGSWDRFKPVAWWPKEAYLASPWQQFQTALRIHARYGFTGWGCWQGPQHAWVRGE